MNEEKQTVTVTAMKAEYLLNLQNELICDFNNAIVEMFEKLSDENKKEYEGKMQTFQEISQKALNKHFIIY